MTIEIHEVDITDGLNKMLYDELKAENEKLKKQLDITLETLGQIAMFSKNTVDAVQAAKAICDIKELDK